MIIDKNARKSWLIYMICGFIPFLNGITFLVLSIKLKKVIGYILSALSIVMTYGSLVFLNTNSGLVSLWMLGILLPIPFSFVFRKAYLQNMDLKKTILHYSIRPDLLLHNTERERELPSTLLDYLPQSKAIFKNKSYAVLLAIYDAEQLLENERKNEAIAAEQKRLAEEKLKKEAEAKLQQKQEADRKKDLEIAQAKAEAAREERLAAEAKERALAAEKAAEKEKAEVKKSLNTPAKLKTKLDKTDLNSCTEAELAQIPEIGIILAKKAINLRNQKGSFESVDEFIKLVGIRSHNIDAVKNKVICSTSSESDESLSHKISGRKIEF